MNRSLLIFIWSMWVQLNAHAQKEWSFENYHYVGQRAETGIVPVLHMETKYHWYSAFRYNYEAAGTFSALTGYSFHGGKDWQYQITPLAGFSAGRFNGWSFGMQAEVSKGRFYISAENQYTKAVDRKQASFLYSWSETGLEIGSFGLLGLSAQYYRDAGCQTFSPGLMAGLRFSRVTLPVYVFDPFQDKRYFVIGVNYAFSR